MLPNNEQITNRQSNTDFLYPRSLPNPLYKSYDQGGIALGDTSRGLTSFAWFCYTDGSNIYVQRLNQVSKQLILTDSNITEVDLTFDQNMNVCIAYVSDGLAKLYFFDSSLAKYVSLEFPDIKYPRVSLDDKRLINAGDTDIIFAYMKGNQLCMRKQRDRFSIEKVLKTYPHNKKILWKIGMGQANRFMFYVR